MMKLQSQPQTNKERLDAKGSEKRIHSVVSINYPSIRKKQRGHMLEIHEI